MSRRADVRPASLEAHASGVLRAKVDEALEALADCRLCPRDCGVDRLARVSSAFPHFGEEDCLRGWRGSGTFCQNFDVSWEGEGHEMNADEIAGQMLLLQQQGCHNIN